MDLRVTGLGVGQYLADKLHRALYLECVALFLSFYYQGGVDHLRGGRYVQQEGFSVAWRN